MSGRAAPGILYVTIRAGGAVITADYSPRSKKGRWRGSATVRPRRGRPAPAATRARAAAAAARSAGPGPAGRGRARAPVALLHLQRGQRLLVLLAEVAQVAAVADAAGGARAGEHQAEDEDDGHARAREHLPLVVQSGHVLVEDGEPGAVGVVEDDRHTDGDGGGSQEKTEEHHGQISSAVTPEGNGGSPRCQTETGSCRIRGINPVSPSGGKARGSPPAPGVSDGTSRTKIRWRGPCPRRPSCSTWTGC